MTQDQKTAVFRLTLESLTKDREEWMPWILELTDQQSIRLLTLILDNLRPMSGEQMDRLLILLGTYAETMQDQVLTVWAPAILLARNRTLAARMPLPPE